MSEYRIMLIYHPHKKNIPKFEYMQNFTLFSVYIVGAVIQTIESIWADQPGGRRAVSFVLYEYYDEPQKRCSFWNANLETVSRHR